MRTTKLFFDFEFTELTQDALPISLGIVAESGQTFYAEFPDWETPSEWIRENVVPHLRFKHHSTPKVDLDHHAMKGYGADVLRALLQWLAQFERVEMWGDCLAYDWVLFCDLIGGAMELPRHIYYIPFDLATFLHAYGVDPDVDREAYAFRGKVPPTAAKHNALWDAKVIHACWRRLDVEEGTRWADLEWPGTGSGEGEQ